MRKLCEWKGVDIIEAEACSDHIHMLVQIPPKISVSSFMGYLKGKSSLMIFDKHANLKYRYGNREFWCRGYYVDTVGKNKKAIEKKIGVEHHDMGFLYSLSCVAAYKITKNEAARAAALKAADVLVSRYHEKGQFIQAWGEMGNPENYRLIIDALLNIPLLYWAAEETGKSEYSKIAFNHYKTTAENIIRDDGTTYHTFYFDVDTGKPVRGVTAQGYSDNSCWARGQAWGVYGSILTYGYKQYDGAIDFFKKAADCFLDKLPDDKVAYWDMIFKDGDEERDSSAAAIAVCGLMEGAKYLKSETERNLYMNSAMQILNSLVDNYSAQNGSEAEGILLHGVYDKRGGFGVDECLIWGDYFYMEALMRIYDKEWNMYW